MIDSARYWEARYAGGGNSGTGSSGHLAAFKAEIVNHLVRKYGIRSVLELGCGDGRQLALARYPSYIGVDVSATAIRLCQERFAGDASKAFILGTGDGLRADMVISLEVIFHLVEDDVFESYMRRLVAAGDRLLVIYSSNRDPDPASAPHVRHRHVVRWMTANAPEWGKPEVVRNRYPRRSFSDFFIYRRRRVP